MFITSTLNHFRNEMIATLTSKESNAIGKYCIKQAENLTSYGTISFATLSSIIHIATVAFAIVAPATGTLFVAVVITGTALASLAVILAIAYIIIRKVSTSRRFQPIHIPQTFQSQKSTLPSLKNNQSLGSSIDDDELVIINAPSLKEKKLFQENNELKKEIVNLKKMISDLKALPSSPQGSDETIKYFISNLKSKELRIELLEKSNKELNKQVQSLTYERDQLRHVETDVDFRKKLLELLSNSNQSTELFQQKLHQLKKEYEHGDNSPRGKYLVEENLILHSEVMSLKKQLAAVERAFRKLTYSVNKFQKESTPKSSRKVGKYEGTKVKSLPQTNGAFTTDEETDHFDETDFTTTTDSDSGGWEVVLENEKRR